MKMINEFLRGNAARIKPGEKISGKDIGIYDMILYDPVQKRIVKNDDTLRYKYIGDVDENNQFYPNMYDLEKYDFYKFENNLIYQDDDTKVEDLNSYYYFYVDGQKFGVYVDTRIPKSMYSAATPLNEGYPFDSYKKYDIKRNELYIFIKDGKGILYRGNELIDKDVACMNFVHDLNSNHCGYVFSDNDKNQFIIITNEYGTITSDKFKPIYKVNGKIIPIYENIFCVKENGGGFKFIAVSPKSGKISVKRKDFLSHWGEAFEPVAVYCSTRYRHNEVNDFFVISEDGSLFRYWRGEWKCIFGKNISIDESGHLCVKCSAKDDKDIIVTTHYKVEDGIISNNDVEGFLDLDFTRYGIDYDIRNNFLKLYGVKIW